MLAYLRYHPTNENGALKLGTGGLNSTLFNIEFEATICMEMPVASKPNLHLAGGNSKYGKSLGDWVIKRAFLKTSQTKAYPANKDTA